MTECFKHTRLLELEGMGLNALLTETFLRHSSQDLFVYLAQPARRDKGITEAAQKTLVL